MWFAANVPKCRLISFDASRIPYTMNFELNGPSNTPYQNGIFYLRLEFSLQYPKIAPSVTFENKIWHINVNQDDGNVFVKCLTDDNWDIDVDDEDVGGSTTIVDIMRDIKRLMKKQVLSSQEAILNDEAFNMYRKNLDEYQEKAKEWTQKWATQK